MLRNLMTPLCNFTVTQLRSCLNALCKGHGDVPVCSVSCPRWQRSSTHQLSPDSGQGTAAALLSGDGQWQPGQPGPACHVTHAHD